MLVKNEELDEYFNQEWKSKSKSKASTKPKRITRGLIRRMRNNNKDAEEGKYFEKELSTPERSYSPTTVEESETGSPIKKMVDLLNSSLSK